MLPKSQSCFESWVLYHFSDLQSKCPSCLMDTNILTWLFLTVFLDTWQCHLFSILKKKKKKTLTQLITKYLSFHPVGSPYLSMIPLSQCDIVVYDYSHQFYISDSLKPSNLEYRCWLHQSLIMAYYVILVILYFFSDVGIDYILYTLFCNSAIFNFCISLPMDRWFNQFKIC